ncbi:Uma2 family endonuclease [Gemmata sp. G18]|uniref:Uma2 family endonuclease n=1 Tax=Gemmata palustris TaxID=2822762 RepID=A0ABS5BYX3_9BACT|nr:Uma2 family endonuclease [Gemmata palustris]MBP3958927.1 Uma2 family endonuclease [Gemmata palustris]
MTPAGPPNLDLGRIKVLYERAEQRYLRALPLEHFMESTTQATQRKITVESFDLIHVSRPDVQCFNELLVQYPPPGGDPDKPGQVVPDNMVIIHPRPIVADGSYMTPLQPVGPFLVIEYVSKASVRKDAEVSYEKYERELKVPYYLLFYPDADELTLFRLGEDGYVTTRPNANGRYPIPELEVEVALLGGWVRYWFRGELLPLPGDLLKERDAERKARLAAEKRASEADAELAKLRAELAKAKGQQP